MTAMTHVWRLVKSRYASSAFDGEGARVYGGRWNSPGVRAAYASDNAALAVLEVLVHLDVTATLSTYSLVEASLPNESIDELDTSRLPDDWSTSPVPARVQMLGDAWMSAGQALALRVPSTLVPGASNLLINPAHPDIDRFQVVSILPFAFDRRLLR